MLEQTDTSPSPITVRLVNALHVEAMLLADEARSYFDHLGNNARDLLRPIERVSFSCESLKVTTRLMHVIAWLLTQRAVAAGEIDSDSGNRPSLQLGETVNSDAAVLEHLPVDARALIDASIDLYDRVRRLDLALRQPVAPANAARQLHNQLARAF